MMVVVTPPDECARHGKAWMLTQPPAHTWRVWTDDGLLYPLGQPRHSWVCIGCCIEFGAAPLRTP